MSPTPVLGAASTCRTRPSRSFFGCLSARTSDMIHYGALAGPMGGPMITLELLISSGDVGAHARGLDLDGDQVT
jgi:hypothetical protein